MIAQQQGQLVIVRPPCKQQTNSYDCLLFAIANAVEFCNTSEIKYIDFDETAMKSHWIGCLQSKNLVPFPRRASRPKKAKEGPQLDVIEVSCNICCLPDEYDNMVACDNCEKWSHLCCVNLTKAPSGKNKWYCPECVLQTHQGYDN